MRIFFALPISAHSSLNILHWRDKVFPRDRQGIAAENFHITLSFVGEASTAQCDTLIQATTELWQRVRPQQLSMTIDQYAYWPSPGTFWIGPRSWNNSLNDLNRQLNELSQRCVGRSAKQTFQPHISLYRTKEAIPQPLIEPIFELNFDEVVLFESVSRKQGVYYRELEVWPLQPNYQGAQDGPKSRPLARKRNG